MTRLIVRGLHAGYGGGNSGGSGSKGSGFDVLHGIDLEAGDGVTAIVGANGAGKSTLLSAIIGLIDRRGEVWFDGKALPAAAPVVSLRHGLALVAEGRALFGQMTVQENLELGGWLRTRQQRTEGIARALALFPRLAERATQAAARLSGGEQQMLAVGRALVGSPRLLMLDEPSLGLAPKMIDGLLEALRQIADDGTPVLVVEQNVRRVLTIADEGYVLERGAIVAHDRGKALLGSDIVRKAFLGVERAASDR